MTAVLEVKNLIKRFPGVTAVNGVSFAIERGICFGLLGPNGAGKTTTIEIMEGLIHADGGEVLYKGRPREKSFKSEVGIQFQSTVLQDYLTTREVLELFHSFYRQTLPLEKLIEMCSLGEFLDRDNRKLSGGQKQRLFLALALVNNPEVIFLDEPTTGLDPQARQNFWKLIQGIKAESKTIILTTHYMEEASVLCDEIAIMDRGQIIAMDTPTNLLESHYKGVSLEIPQSGFSPPADFPWVWNHHGTTIAIQTEDVNATLTWLMKREVSLENLRVKIPTLEDLFLDLTGHDLRG